MNLILLPGSRRESNEEWIQDVQKALDPLFDSSKIIKYRHWDTGEPSTDIEHEFQSLAQLVLGLDEYLVFAKSIGVLVSLKAIYEQKIKPAKCVFVGSAISWALNENYPIREHLSGYAIPTLFIQKTNDPAISFQDLKTLVDNLQVPNCRFTEIPGDNHHYDDVDQIKDLIQNFLPVK